MPERDARGMMRLRRRPKTGRLVRQIKRTPGLVIPLAPDEHAIYEPASDMVYVYAKMRWL